MAPGPAIERQEAFDPVPEGDAGRSRRRGHQLAGVGEPTKVPDLGRQHHGREEGNAAHRLQGSDDRRQRPGGHQLPDLLTQTVAPTLGLGDGVDLLLQHDLLGGVGEAEPGQPAPVCGRPSLPAATIRS